MDRSVNMETGKIRENAKVSVHFINKLGCTLYSFFLTVVV